MRAQRVLPWLAVPVLVLTLVGCPRGGGAPAGAQTVDVTLTDFAIQPQTIEMNRGTAMFRITNKGPSVHNFEVLNVPGARSQDLAPGANQNMEIKLDQPGEYQVACTVPGHSELGMVGTLRVR